MSEETIPPSEPEPEPVVEEVAVDKRIRGHSGRPWFDDESVIRWNSLQSHRCEEGSLEDEWLLIMGLLEQLLEVPDRMSFSPDELHDKFCVKDSPDFLFDKEDIKTWKDVRREVLKRLEVQHTEEDIE